MTGVEVECDLNISNFCSLSCTLIFMIDGPSIWGNILLKNTFPIRFLLLLNIFIDNLLASWLLTSLLLKPRFLTTQVLSYLSGIFPFSQTLIKSLYWLVATCIVWPVWLLSRARARDSRQM